MNLGSEEVSVSNEKIRLLSVRCQGSLVCVKEPHGGLIVVSKLEHDVQCECGSQHLAIQFLQYLDNAPSPPNRDYISGEGSSPFISNLTKPR